MKILVICQHYYPEPFRLTDICEELVKRGHEVSVVTGTPNYPMGEIYPGYENKAHQDEVINGVNVHRCAIHPRKTGTIHRVWNYYSYANASSRYVKKLDGAFDVVLINQLSPVMMANAGIKYAKKHGKKSVLYCLDLWPASLGAGGISNGPIYKWFHRVSKKIYRSADQILITSKSFADYFAREFGIENTVYLPQYAEETFTVADCAKGKDGFVDLMFAGNVGAAQSVDTIIRAAALCKDIENLRWHIVGDGKEFDACKRLANDLSVPVIFHGRHAIDEMPKFYAMADAMLVTMKKDPIICLTLPGKVQSYMAAGKPIIGAIDGETAEVIGDANCGYCGASDAVEALAQNVRKFIEDVNGGRADTFGINSRTYYEKHFTGARFFEQLLILLKSK